MRIQMALAFTLMAAPVSQGLGHRRFDNTISQDRPVRELKKTDLQIRPR